MVAVMGEPLEERQVEYSTDKGRTWIYYDTYPSKDAAALSVQKLCRQHPDRAWKRKAFRPAYRANGTLAGSHWDDN